jgi:formamidopyrimidine-DNA glycosylase
MPEGIEVRKYGDILRSNILGKTITKINILKGRYKKKAFDGLKELDEMLPVKVTSIDSKGKFTYITLESQKAQKSVKNDNKTLYLFSTLGLSGGWTILHKEKNKCKTKMHFNGKEYDISIFNMKKAAGYYCYPRVLEYISNNDMSTWFEHALNNLNIEFELDDDSKLYYYDQRNFGTMKIITDIEELQKKLSELGPDMMDISLEDFKKAITKGVNVKKAVGNVIVNQKLVSGIGNYLRADTLWMAKVSPFRKVADLTDKEMELIYKSVRALMWGDYNLEYAREKGYVTKDLKIPLDCKRDFFVYMQDTDIDGNKVTKEELFEGSQKRFIHWVDTIQV